MLVAVPRVPHVRLAGEDRHVPTSQREHDREGLEREDRADDERGLQARSEQRKDHVDRAPDAVGPKEIGGLEEVAWDELETGDEYQQNDGCGPPGLRDDDGAQDPAEVLER